MEIRHLNLIKTISEEKGITKSSGKLFLTQSAVSHQLKDIEERIGAKIFYRAKKQWLLTDEGRTLYDTAVIILNQLNTAMRKVNNVRWACRFYPYQYSVLYQLSRQPSFLTTMNALYSELEVIIIINY